MSDKNPMSQPPDRPALRVDRLSEIVSDMERIIAEHHRRGKRQRRIAAAMTGLVLMIALAALIVW